MKLRISIVLPVYNQAHFLPEALDSIFAQTRMACVGLYDPEFIYGEDWEYRIRISRCYPMKHVPAVLYRYRLHETA